MPPNQKHHTREFTRIEQLLDTYNFKEALQAVETLEHQDDLSPPDRLTCHLLKSQLLNNLGRYEETLRLTDAIISESQRQRKRLHRVDALIARAEALGFLGRFKEGLDAIEQGEHELAPLARDQPAEVPQRTAALLYHKGWIYYWKGEWDRALEYAQQSLALREKLGHKPTIGWSLFLIGWIYNKKGDGDRAGEYGQQCLGLAKELGHKPLIGCSLLLIGWGYIWKGKLDRTWEYGQKGLALAKELGYKPLIALFLHFIGIIYHDKGELDRAVDYIQQSLALHEELGFKAGIGSLLNNIGHCYMCKGELDQALEYLKQSLVLYEELGNKRAIAVPLANIGIICFLRGEWDQAIAYLEQSLPLYEEAGNKVIASETLYYLISVAIDQKMLEQARQYLQRLQQLNEQEDNKIISQRYRVAEALVLKTSPRALHRDKAEELLKQVVEEEIVAEENAAHEVTVAALLHLCDLLLVELRTSDAPEVLGEVQAHVTRLREIAKQQHSYWLLAETYVLQAKLALLDLDIPRARHLLTQAQTIAEEKGLQRLARNISHEHNTLLSQLNQWKAIQARKASPFEVSQLVGVEAQVVRMIRKRLKEVYNNLLKDITNTFQILKAPISTKTHPLSLNESILHKYPYLKYDDISKAIISCLERKKRLNISQLTEEVRNQRGRASRRIIRERVNHLINQGIIEELDEGYGRQLRVIPLSDG